LDDLIDACLRLSPAQRPTLDQLLSRLEPVTGVSAADRRWSR
jgi:hypothetical protein